MNRRQVLQQLGWGISGGLLVPSFIASCAKKDPGPEILFDGSVAVIGAGAAGLYVADILRSKGISVKVFEAREQIGGRVRSLRNQSIEKYPLAPLMASDFPIELGAQTIIGTDSVFGKIFQDYTLPTIEYSPSANHFVLDNKPKSDADWGGDADFVAARNFRSNLAGRAGSSASAQQSIAAEGIRERAFGMLNAQIGNAYGSNNERIGIGALGEAERLRTNDGKIIGLRANPMQDALISRFSAVQSSVQLNTPITNINYGADPIVLTAKNGSSYEAKKVIVTVPVSILKSGGLSFSPGLPGGITSSLAKIGMGASLRVVIEFKRNFWGDSVGFILGSTNVPEYFSTGIGRGQFNRTLAITVNGDKAAQYSALGPGVVPAILADLDLLYDGQGTKFIRKVIENVNGNNVETDKGVFIMEDWTKMEYVQGGYSYPLPGAKNDDRKALGQSVNKKLFFAGEATDITGQAGTVNGALTSAERAAQEVIESIRNP